MSARTYIKTNSTANDDELTILIELLITELGVPSHLKGFKYLSLAVNIVYSTPSAIRSVITGLYSKIADIHGTTVSCVERDMRTALKTAVNSGKLPLFDEYFACALTNTNSIPPRRFIAILSEKLRCQLIMPQEVTGKLA